MAWPALELPIRPPFPPMEARLEDELPPRGAWQYEPKWDGFRCLLFKDGDAVALQSKAGQPLGRYFPELVEGARDAGAPKLVLDGEIVIPSPGGLSFEALLQRIHPAESRVRRLALETPSLFYAFDLLVDGRGKEVTGLPLSSRRAALEDAARAFSASFRLSPASRDREEAEAWLAGAGKEGTDGVVAKLLGEPYRSGERVAMVKVKRERTADCVVGGFRRGKGGRDLASLLLGLYAEDGRLHYVGHAAAFSREERAKLTAIFEPLARPEPDGTPPTSFTGDAPGGPSRWATERSMEWTPVVPLVVVEVGWRHSSGGRFRHGVRLIRFRPDKAAAECTFDQLAGVASRSFGGATPRGP